MARRMRLRAHPPHLPIQQSHPCYCCQTSQEDSYGAAKITSVPPVCPLVDMLMSNATAPEDTAGVCMRTLVRKELVFVMSLKVQCRNNFYHLLKGIHLLETSLCRKERNPASMIHFVSSTSTRKVIETSDS